MKEEGLGKRQELAKPRKKLRKTSESHELFN